MSEDSRCCGTGTCMINASGQCWCGQRWDGETMCAPAPLKSMSDDPDDADDDAEKPGTE
jgi:hypothetical protein